MNKSNLFLFCIVSISIFSCSAMEIVKNEMETPQEQHNNKLIQYRNSIDDFYKDAGLLKTQPQATLWHNPEKELRLKMITNLKIIRDNVDFVIRTIQCDKRAPYGKSLRIEYINKTIKALEKNNPLTPEAITEYQEVIPKIANFSINQNLDLNLTSSIVLWEEVLLKPTDATELLTVSDNELTALLNQKNEAKKTRREEYRKAREKAASEERERQTKELERKEELKSKQEEQKKHDAVIKQAQADYEQQKKSRQVDLLKNISLKIEKEEDEKKSAQAKAEAQKQAQLQRDAQEKQQEQNNAVVQQIKAIYKHAEQIIQDNDSKEVASIIAKKAAEEKWAEEERLAQVKQDEQQKTLEQKTKKYEQAEIKKTQSKKSYFYAKIGAAVITIGGLVALLRTYNKLPEALTNILDTMYNTIVSNRYHNLANLGWNS